MASRPATPFERYMARARKESLVSLHKYDNQTARLYIDLASTVKEELRNTKGYWQKEHLKGVIRSLREAAVETGGQYKSVIDEALNEAAGIQANGFVKGMKQYFNVLDNADLGLDTSKFLRLIPKDAVSAIYQRAYDDGLFLSDRIWSLNVQAQQGISKIVTEGLARGLHYDDPRIAQQLDRFLQPARLLKDSTQAKQVSPTITRKLKDGTEFTFRQRPISYDAARLLRTEWGNAYREAANVAAQENPACIGERWLLANTHPDIGCECEEYAAHDEGLGEGVFPVGEAPDDVHPNCLCTIEQVLISVDEFMTWVDDFRTSETGPIAGWWQEYGEELAA